MISPEIPEKSKEMALNNTLKLQIVSDSGNKLAREFGLAFALPEELRPIYKGFGIDLPAANGDSSYELPVPATYLIGQDQRILLDFIDADHTKRLEPTDLVSFLRDMKK